MKISTWSDLVPKTDSDTLAAVERLKATVGQIEIDLPEGKVVYTVVKIKGETLCYGVLVTNSTEVLYEVDEVKDNYNAAAALWNLEADVPFPPISDLVFENWENVIYWL